MTRKALPPGGGRCRGHAITKVARLAAVQAAREVSDSLARANAWGADKNMRGLAIYLSGRLESDAHDLAVALALLEQGRYSDAHKFLTDVLRPRPPKTAAA